MRRVLLAVLAVTVVLVLAVGLKARWSPAGSPAPSSSRPPAAVTGTPSSSPSLGSTPASTALPAGRHVVRGDLVQVDYGPVQVEVTVAAGRITQVRAVKLPDADPMDVQISVPAARRLAAAVLAAQSADVDAVTGATYTSDGYLRSLQSALDRLHAMA
jgi:uncharacterized protein with FMN-binding domain